MLFVFVNCIMAGLTNGGQQSEKFKLPSHYAFPLEIILDVVGLQSYLRTAKHTLEVIAYAHLALHLFPVRVLLK